MNTTDNTTDNATEPTFAQALFSTDAEPDTTTAAPEPKRSLIVKGEGSNPTSVLTKDMEARAFANSLFSHIA